MQWLYNLRIRTKLLVMTGVLLALTIMVGAFSLWRMASVSAEGQKIGEVFLPSVQHLGEVSEISRRIQSLQFQHIAMSDKTGMDAIESQLKSALVELDSARHAYEVLPAVPEETAAYERMTKKWQTYMAPREEILALSRSLKTDEATVQLVGTLDEYQAMEKELQEVSAINQRGAVAATAKAAELAANARLAVIIAIVLAAMIGVGFATVVSNRISAAVRILDERTTSLRNICIASTRKGLVAMAAGDLTVKAIAGTKPINSPDLDEVGDISRAIDGIVVEMQAMEDAYASTQESIQGVIHETQSLVTAASRGQLTKRANVATLQGAYKQLVEGMNNMLAAVESPISEAKGVLALVADRDLTGRMTGSYEGDYAEMQQSINTAVENLESTLQQVSTAATQVAAASTQITSGGQSLASSASEQAASLEEVSASMQEFATSARQNAANAKDARGMAVSARTDATEGAARVARLTEAVNDIKQSSTETAKIMKSIEEIAFQTNLLALNAAVEAARAGDAGRGFAVVADEVRALALRSAEASKSTAALIERGLSSAERGVALNADVSQSFERINTQVSRVADVIADLSTASEQQAESVAQIDVALEQLNSVTQQVAANAEESASAAEELNGQAGSLNDSVSAFQLTTENGRGRKTGGAAPRSVARRQAAPNRAARPTAVRPAPVFAGSDNSDDDDDVFLGF